MFHFPNTGTTYQVLWQLLGTESGQWQCCGARGRCESAEVSSKRHDSRQTCWSHWKNQKAAGVIKRNGNESRRNCFNDIRTVKSVNMESIMTAPSVRSATQLSISKHLVSLVQSHSILSQREKWEMKGEEKKKSRGMKSWKKFWLVATTRCKSIFLICQQKSKTQFAFLRWRPSTSTHLGGNIM